MIVRAATFAMKTRFELVLVGEDERFLRAVADESVEIIEACEARLSLFRRDSLIARINREGHERPIRLDPETFELLELCRNVHERSDGAFDITVAPLMTQQGFHEGAQLSEGCAAVVGLEHMVLDERERTIRLDRAGVSLDLGGVAKGHALDLAARAISEHGVRCALLHGGTSSVVGLGVPPDGRAWTIGVRAGRRLEPVSLIDCALSVSGAHGRVVGDGNEARGHVMDPRLWDSIGPEGVCWVRARSGALAEAWSTALLVLGERVGRTPDDIDVGFGNHGGGVRSDGTFRALPSRGRTMQDTRMCEVNGAVN